MKSKALAYILWLFTGFAGGHKFYMEKIGMGILYFLTGGLFGVGWFIDLFTMGKQIDECNAKYLAYNGQLPESLYQSATLKETMSNLKNNFVSNAYPTPEKQILTLTKDTNFLTLKDVVANTSLTLEEAEMLLNKMVDKGIAKLSEEDGQNVYFFY